MELDFDIDVERDLANILSETSGDGGKKATAPTAPRQQPMDTSQFLIDLSQPIPEPDPTLKIQDVLVCSKGNISAVVGQPKARKTFLVSAVVGGFFKPDGYLGFNTALENGKVLWIDTEQSRYHAQNVIKRVHKIAGFPLNERIPHFRAFATREFEPNARMELIRREVAEFSPDLVIIDGISELLLNTNCLEESGKVIAELMRLSTQCNNHIVVVLHANFGSVKARGHVGSELLRKAETIFLADLNNDVTTVTAQFTRNMPFKDFAFQIDENALPSSCPVPQKQKKVKDNEFLEVLEDGVEYKHSELVELAMEELELKKSGAKTKIRRAVEEDGFLEKTDEGLYRLPRGEPRPVIPSVNTKH